MAKYRGKHNGRTRGPYVREALLSVQNSRDETIVLQRELNHFFCGKGYWAASCSNHNDRYTEIGSAYHVAGATIGMTATSYKTEPESSLPQHFLELKLISNDKLDDIIQKITNEFPMFKKADPDWL